MLHVTYEAVGDLPPGTMADIEEDRGRIRVRLDRDAPLVDVVQQLNVEVEQFLARSNWFQLWGREIVCRDSPGSSLRVVYRIDSRAPSLDVGMGEKKGLVTVYIPPALDTKRFAAAMNPAVEEFLAGGQWFQMYAGEIIDMTPEELTEV